MVKIAVIGTTSWGITLAVMLAQKEVEIRLWARTEREAKRLNSDGPNPTKFPDVVFPPKLIVTSQLGDALDDFVEITAVI